MKKRGNAFGFNLSWRFVFTHPGLMKGIGLCVIVPKRISNGKLSPTLALVIVWSSV